MKNLTTYYSNELLENKENSYLYFQCGENKYAIRIGQVVEIIKLPLLDYPQRLANNAVGLLQYNNFSINVLDLRFYLDIKVSPYSTANQILIVKTDESMFGLIIDKAEGIITLDESKIEYMSPSGEEKIIKFMYKEGEKTISIVGLTALESKLRKGVAPVDFDIPTLFPNDDDSRYVMTQRSNFLEEKASAELDLNLFSQDKFISFSLSDSTYCIDLSYLKEFLKNVPITKIPCNRDYIAGVAALKGDFVTVIDTKKFIGLETNIQTNAAFKNNIIIVEVSDYTIGFLVDEIFSIINIPEELIKADSQISSKYILSEVIIDNKVYNLLNMNAILSDEKLFIEEK